MFRSIEYLRTGNLVQQKAFHRLTELNLMNDLSEFNPILCGTIPIGIDVKGSDLDIITEIHDLIYFENKIKEQYQFQDDFTFSHSLVREIHSVTINFTYKEFEIEIFGQPTPVIKQNAYLHMLIEHNLLERFPYMRDEVINLKKQGFKTERAFCKILGLNGDPYERLIEYGKSRGLIF